MTLHDNFRMLVFGFRNQWSIVMERFLERHRDGIVGVLSGFDRLLFRGSLRSISYINGLEIFLSSQRVLIKDFGPYVERLSSHLKEHAQEFAKKHGRPYIYLPSSGVSKEDLARDIAQKDGITDGLICVLACIEPCQTYQVRRNRETRHVELAAAERKCLHLYFYFQDREFGFMHVRLQTWLPMAIQICINGREYLARQMDYQGIRYEQRDNCFVQIEDLTRAQQLLDRLTTRKWERVLGALAARVNPWIRPVAGLNLRDYYWSVRQGEFATDILFGDEAALRAVYPSLVDHAMRQFSCNDVLRFLGRRTNSRSNGEVKTHLQQRHEGVRIKHWVEENSLKMYDKQGCVLRVETTINNPRRFKVRRKGTRKGKSCMAWLPSRKGIADMARRVEISRAANERYLDALSVVSIPAPTAKVLDPVQRRIIKDGRPYRALRPLTLEESTLFCILLRGEHALQGFRNVDIRQALYPADERESTARRSNSGRTTRWLRLLRAHRLIRKVPSTQYYRVTPRGNSVMSTALKLRECDIGRLAG
jgi:hypothetical protein